MAASRANVLLDFSGTHSANNCSRPDKLEKADKANIGSLSWEIQQRAREQGGNDLARRVGTLSPAAIDALVNAPRYGGAGILSSYGGIRDERGYVIPSEETSQRLPGTRSGSIAEISRTTG